MVRKDVILARGLKLVSPEGYDYLGNRSEGRNPRKGIETLSIAAARLFRSRVRKDVILERGLKRILINVADDLKEP